MVAGAACVAKVAVHVEVVAVAAVLVATGGGSDEKKTFWLLQPTTAWSSPQLFIYL